MHFPNHLKLTLTTGSQAKEQARVHSKTSNHALYIKEAKLDNDDLVIAV